MPLGARVVQRHILYLGELNDAAGFGVQIRLEAMRLERPRQWGACWLAAQIVFCKSSGGQAEGEMDGFMLR